ncbi:unnamed protein product [Gadus morhua 'NCC']
MRQKEALVIAGEVHSQANTRLFLPDSCPHIKLDTDSCSPAVELAEDTTANREITWSGRALLGQGSPVTWSSMLHLREKSLSPPRSRHHHILVPTPTGFCLD